MKRARLKGKDPARRLDGGFPSTDAGRRSAQRFAFLAALDAERPDVWDALCRAADVPAAAAACGLEAAWIVRAVHAANAEQRAMNWPRAFPTLAAEDDQTGGWVSTLAADARAESRALQASGTRRRGTHRDTAHYTWLVRAIVSAVPYAQVAPPITAPAVFNSCRSLAAMLGLPFPRREPAPV